MKRFIPILFLLGFCLSSPTLANDEANAAAQQAAEQAFENMKAYKALARGLQEAQPAFQDLPASLPPELQEQIPELPNGGGIASAGSSRLMVFLTLTMPDEALRGWLDETARAGGVAVIRGFHGGKMSTTLARIHELRDGDKNLGANLQIDPTAFSRLDVKVAPTVIALSAPLLPCKSNGCVGDIPPPVDRIAGNTSLAHALGRIANEGTVARQSAKHHLAKLNGGHNGK